MCHWSRKGGCRCGFHRDDGAPTAHAQPGAPATPAVPLLEPQRCDASTWLQSKVVVFRCSSVCGVVGGPAPVICPHRCHWRRGTRRPSMPSGKQVSAPPVMPPVSVTERLLRWFCHSPTEPDPQCHVPRQLWHKCPSCAPTCNRPQRTTPARRHLSGTQPVEGSASDFADRRAGTRRCPRPDHVSIPPFHARWGLLPPPGGGAHPA